MTTRKTGLDLSAMIDPTAAPVDTGIPQRGAEYPRRRKRMPLEERRIDQMSIRMTTRTRERIEAIAASRGCSVADLIEDTFGAPPESD